MIDTPIETAILECTRRDDENPIKRYDRCEQARALTYFERVEHRLERLGYFNGSSKNGKDTGFVYFIITGTEECPQQVKIGFTRGEPYSRLKALQTGCPFPLTLYGFVLANEATEKRLHFTLAGDRLSGEWFEFTHSVAGCVHSTLLAEIIE